MDQRKHDIAIKLLKKILDKEGIKYELRTTNYGRRDGFFVDILVIYVDSSRYQMDGSNYESRYASLMEFIEDYIDKKLSKFGLEDHLNLEIRYLKTNYDWVKDKINRYITTKLDPEETNPESYYDLVADLERNPFLTITTDVKKLKKWLEPNFYDMFIDSNDQSG